MTLLFLGERNEAETHEAQAVVREVAATHEPFKASLAGLGAFPVPARPRVVWLGLEDSPPVQKLHRALRREHDRLGMPRENRAYRPHVTLGRVPPTAEADTHKALHPALATVRFEAPVTFSSVDLYTERTDTARSALHSAPRRPACPLKRVLSRSAASKQTRRPPSAPTRYGSVLPAAR